MALKHWGALEPDTEGKARNRKDDLMKPRVEALVSDAGWKVYVSPAMAKADVKTAADQFAREVRHETEGRLRGEIRGYGGEGSPPTSGDMRDTWALTLVDPKTRKVVDYFHVTPLADMDANYDVEHEHARELLDREDNGEITHAQALKLMQDDAQSNAQTVGSYEVDTMLGSLQFEEMFPKYESWLSEHRDRKAVTEARPRGRVWTPPAVPKRPVPVRAYWRRGMTRFVEPHRREWPRGAGRR